MKELLSTLFVPSPCVTCLSTCVIQLSYPDLVESLSPFLHDLLLTRLQAKLRDHRVAVVDHILTRPNLKAALAYCLLKQMQVNLCGVSPRCAICVPCELPSFARFLRSGCVPVVRSGASVRPPLLLLGHWCGPRLRLVRHALCGGVWRHHTVAHTCAGICRAFHCPLLPQSPGG